MADRDKRSLVKVSIKMAILVRGKIQLKHKDGLNIFVSKDRGNS